MIVLIHLLGSQVAPHPFGIYLPKVKRYLNEACSKKQSWKTLSKNEFSNFQKQMYFFAKNLTPNATRTSRQFLSLTTSLSSVCASTLASGAVDRWLGGRGRWSMPPLQILQELFSRIRKRQFIAVCPSIFLELPLPLSLH